jgi:hypothetical protein
MFGIHFSAACPLFDDGYMVIAMHLRTGIVALITCGDLRAWRHRTADEAAKRLGATSQILSRSHTDCIIPSSLSVEAAATVWKYALEFQQQIPNSKPP